MFFSKFFALAALPLLAVAGGEPTRTVTVTAQPSSTPASSCSTGDLQCCNSVASASSPAGIAALALAELVVQGVDAAVGITCSPITAVGLAAGGCSAKAVCCEDNSSHDIVSVGCIPVTL